jgi:hypothetical protein
MRVSLTSSICFLVLGAIALLCQSGFISNARADDKMAIEVIREKVVGGATMGELGVNGQTLCYTLEPAPGGGSEGKGAIPEGTYTAHLRYDKKDQWRIQLDDVPGFTGIQIHIGNYPKDTEGCILVGMDSDEDAGTLSRSSEAYAALKRAFYGSDDPDSTPDKEITVVISSKI